MKGSWVRVFSVVVAAVVAVWGAPASGAEEAEEAGRDARPAAEVIEELLAARSGMGPLEAEFSWVIGVLGVDQQRLQGQLFIVDGDRYRVDFESAETGGGLHMMMVPDGQWAYEFAQAPGALGARVNLAYVKRKVRSPTPRIPYDPTGGALLELLQLQGYVTYEGDEELAEGRCAVLSYQGGSWRTSSGGTPGAQADATLRTRIFLRWEDGLLVREEEVHGQGHLLSSYRVFNPRPFQPQPGLLKVPMNVYCVDVTKQLVRRALYGPPRLLPSPTPRSAAPASRPSGP